MLRFHQARGLRGWRCSTSPSTRAWEFNIPSELLAKILQRLAKRRLIVGHSDPKGGYRLASKPEELTVGQVVRALEGPIAIATST
jgi:DNA-binding IscR family transcriptional regulator